MKRICNGFTAESQRTNDGPAFAFRLPPYGGGRGERPWSFLFPDAKLLILSHIQKNHSKKMQIHPIFSRKALMLSGL